MKAEVYNLEGKKTGTVDLSKDISEIKWNPDLIHQAVRSHLSNKKNPVHKKDRSEVAGGGRKPWRQKGTGRARHGSNRSPIWAGGGVTHGPLVEKNHSKKINDKARKKAFLSVISKKILDNELVFVEGISGVSGKTKNAESALSGLSKIKGFDELTDKRTKKIIAIEGVAAKTAFRNIKNLTPVEARNLNVLDLLNTRYVVIDKRFAEKFLANPAKEK